MAALEDCQAAYRAVWSSHPYSNISIILAWGENVIRAWIRKHQVRFISTRIATYVINGIQGRGNDSYHNLEGPWEGCLAMRSVDCVVLALKVEHLIRHLSRSHVHG